MVIRCIMRRAWRYKLERIRLKWKIENQIIARICKFHSRVGMYAIGYHMNGEIVLVLSFEGRYYNCHEQAQRANYDIVTEPIM